MEEVDNKNFSWHKVVLKQLSFGSITEQDSALLHSHQEPSVHERLLWLHLARNLCVFHLNPTFDPKTTPKWTIRGTGILRKRLLDADTVGFGSSGREGLQYIFVFFSVFVTEKSQNLSSLLLVLMVNSQSAASLALSAHLSVENMHYFSRGG